MADLQDDGVVRFLGVSNFTRSQLAAARQATSASLIADQVMYHPYKEQRALHAYCVDNEIALTAYSPLARGDVPDDPLLRKIGQQYEKSPAQVALRWLLQQDQVVAVPKATSRDHLEENLAVFDFALTEAEMTEIRNISPGVRRRVRNLWPAVMRHIPV